MKVKLNNENYIFKASSKKFYFENDKNLIKIKSSDVAQIKDIYKIFNFKGGFLFKVAIFVIITSLLMSIANNTLFITLLLITVSFLYYINIKKMNRVRFVLKDNKCFDIEFLKKGEKENFLNNFGKEGMFHFRENYTKNFKDLYTKIKENYEK